MKPATKWWASAGQEGALAAKAGQIALAMLVTVACGGCVSIGKRIDQQQLAQIKIGVSTRAEVEKLLGSPRAISETSTGGTMLTYAHLRGWIVPPGQYLLPPAVTWLWTGGTSSTTEGVAITCDCNGIVSNVTTFALELESGTGLLDRKRQSLSWTHRDEPDSNRAETAHSASGSHPESTGPAPTSGETRDRR